MANGLDRLERLFAYKRKASRESSPNRRLGSAVPSLDQQFPSPSFIRPKTSRMTARQEVRLGQASNRSPSIPDLHAAQRVDYDHNFGSVPLVGKYHQPKHRLARLPTSSHRQTESLLSALREFQFPRPPNRNDAASPRSTRFPVEQSAKTPRLPSPRCRSPFEISAPFSYRLNTPPCSDPEDNGSDCPSPTTKAPPVSCPTRLPTPDQSHEIGTAQDSHVRSVKSADCTDEAVFEAIENQLGESFDQRSMERTCSQSSIAESSDSCCSSVLREPDFNEFFSLSDDDIAEPSPDSPVVAPADGTTDPTSPRPPSDVWISSSEPLTSRLLTLTAPRASRPAAAAAFEAARIARRYDFDLVYVVNLWPHTPCPTKPNHKPMVGRLLAAHGLHHVPSPLEISEEVHTTILRSDGWIEYRDREALPHDIARGYACAFYTGRYARSSSPRGDSPVSGVRLSERIDRGIIFAAYRKPRDGQDKLGRTFGDAELGELHKDAEALVEMVIDIHVANRNRQGPCRTSLTDDTGPIPTRRLQVA